MTTGDERLNLYRRPTDGTVERVDSWTMPANFLEVLTAVQRADLDPSQLFFDKVMDVEWPPPDLHTPPTLYLGRSVISCLAINPNTRTAITIPDYRMLPLRKLSSQFEALTRLASEPYTPVSREALQELLGQRTLSAVDTVVGRLRESLGDYAELIQTDTKHHRGFYGILDFDPSQHFQTEHNDD